MDVSTAPADVRKDVRVCSLLHLFAACCIKFIREEKIFRSEDVLIPMLSSNIQLTIDYE
jgi:hypothetical protein